MRVRIPYRFKIVATVLVLVTAAVSIITFTMARMFHTDKSAYVSDLAAVMSVHASEEAAAVIAIESNRLHEVAQVIDDPDIPSSRKRALLTQKFDGTSACLAIRIFEKGREIGSLADTLSARDASLVRAALSVPLEGPMRDLEPGTVKVIRVESADTPGHIVALLVSRPAAGNRRALVLAALLDADRAFAPGGGSSAFDLFLADEAGHVLWHSDPDKLNRYPELPVVARLQPGSRVVVNEYSLGGVQMIGGFASVRGAALRAGAQIPKAAALFASRQLLRDLMWVALLLLLCAAVVSLVWSSRLTRSLSHLADAAKLIGRGEFDVKVSVRSQDEMGDLAGSFNQMAMELNARDLALREAQAQLVQSEKMAAFGQLGAGIAHEVKNPLAGIQGIVQLSARSVDPEHPIAKQLAMIEKETKRCRAIIDNLLKFARQEKAPHEPTELAQVVNDTAALMRHQMSLHHVDLRIEIEPELPLIEASANQLQQVLMNLLLNAEQAMEERGHGTVAVSARREGDGLVELLVRDDGPGIPSHAKARIFEPFFTTKATGKGTGLGLSVTFGIVRDHGGQIEVESVEGEGTTFTLRLPIRSGTQGAAEERERTPDEDAESRAA